VLPAFISRLTTSTILIGLASSLENAGWFLPQAFTSNLVAHRRRKKPVYVLAAVVRVTALAAFVPIVALCKDRSPGLVLAGFFTLYSIYSLGGGLAGVCFMDIVGKAIPSDRRGSFWGFRNFWGGLLAVGGGWLVKEILQRWGYPANYAMLFGLATVLVAVALGAFAFVVEPTEPVRSSGKTLKEHLQAGARLVAQSTGLRRLLLARVAFGFCWMAAPFYVLFARRELRFPESSVGLFLSLQMLGLVLSNLLWGRLSAKRGNPAVYTGVLATATITPFLALALPYLRSPFTALALGGCFLGLGAVSSGLQIGYYNVLLDHATGPERPTLVGFLNTIVAPTLFLSAPAGLLIELTSFRILFLVAGAAGLAGLGIARRITDPGPVPGIIDGR
jgi:MFS family permease